MKKTILLNLAVFVVGAAGGFIAARVLLQEKYNQIAQEEIDSVKDHYRKTLASQIAALNEKNGGSELPTAATAQRDIRPNLTRSSLDGGAVVNPYEKAKQAYNLVPHVDDEDEADEEEEDDEPRDAAGKTQTDMEVDPDAVYTERDLSTVDRTRPYLIDDREFSEEFEHHDKVSLYYYRVDDVLVDDDDNIMDTDEIDDAVGFDAFEKLDMQSSVWVRNEVISIDYEIMAINKAYSEQFPGGGRGAPALTPREQHMKKAKREDDD